MINLNFYCIFPSSHNDEGKQPSSFFLIYDLSKYYFQARTCDRDEIHTGFFGCFNLMALRWWMTAFAIDFSFASETGARPRP